MPEAIVAQIGHAIVIIRSKPSHAIGDGCIARRIWPVISVWRIMVIAIIIRVVRPL